MQETMPLFWLNLGTVNAKLSKLSGVSPPPGPLPELCPRPTRGPSTLQTPAGESIHLRSLPHINQVTRLWGAGGGSENILISEEGR